MKVQGEWSRARKGEGGWGSGVRRGAAEISGPSSNGITTAVRQN